MGLFFKSKAEITGRNSCRAKVRYTSDVAALAALKKINPTKSGNKPRRTYKCPHCGGWHLSSQPLR